MRSQVKERRKPNYWKTDLGRLDGRNKIGVNEGNDEMRDLNFASFGQRNRLDNIFLIFSWPRYGHPGLSKILDRRSLLE